MARPAKSIKRTRRIFSAEFKQEAVRRMVGRRWWTCFLGRAGCRVSRRRYDGSSAK
jgi:hypothetical protein